MMPQEDAAAPDAATSRRLPTEMAVTKGFSADAREALSSRSVGQLGSQSDMTRRIAFLHQPGRRRSAAAAHQLDTPEGQAKAGLTGRAARRRCDAPARDRRARRPALRRRRAGRAPAPQHEAGDAARLAGELQAAAGGRCERADLAEHRGQGGAAQPLLHRPQYVAVVTTARDDEALGRETASSQAGGVEIARREAPEDRSVVPARQSGEKSGGECGGDRAILLVGARAQDLVQGTEREAAEGQDRIDRRQPERQDAPTKTPLPERPDALAQSTELGIRRFRQVCLLPLFAICSYKMTPADSGSQASPKEPTMNSPLSRIAATAFTYLGAFASASCVLRLCLG